MVRGAGVFVAGGKGLHPLDHRLGDLAPNHIAVAEQRLRHDCGLAALEELAADSHHHDLHELVGLGRRAALHDGGPLQGLGPGDAAQDGAVELRLLAGEAEHLP